ncbi:MAG TPA: endonuclease/exonuclease/phosphatase family protein [Burkholderiales bacterium]|nr:endonuclease/exonuclease/phosphatase family protein [Burkholderiales bacterium]
MPSILDTPPPEVSADVAGLRAALDAAIPARMLDRNLLIATWNLRAFGDLTEKWQSGAGDSPKRDLHSLLCIAEILSRFDVVAIQESRSNLKALRHTLKALGRNWGLILTDVTEGQAGNGERLAFIFDTRRVRPSGLACELVVPEERLAQVGAGALKRQFARTPYAVSFEAGGKTFILVTLHVLYGSAPADRVGELKTIAGWMAEWAKDVNAWDHSLIALGDFNIDRRSDELYQAFTSTGLKAPEDLNKAPRTLFSDPRQPDTSNFYDQIAWFTAPSGAPMLSLKYQKGGSFDFSTCCLRNRNLARDTLSWHISDHFPLWAEFGVRD